MQEDLLLHGGPIPPFQWLGLLAALAWQPGSWAFRPLLVAYSTGHALMVHADGGANALPVKTGLSSCVAAEWGPSGNAAALLGVPAFGSASLTASCSAVEPASAGTIQQHRGAPGALLLLVHASGEALACVDLSAGDPRALAWAPSGERLAASAEGSVLLLSLRHEGTCCFYGDATIAAVEPLIPQELVTKVCFWSEQGGGRNLRSFRGPRLLVSGDERCAVVPYATSALPPDFLWENERHSALQEQSQQQHGPYVLADEGAFRESPISLHKTNQQKRPEGFPVELCDSSGNTVETVLCPLSPRHAVLLPHWLVISDGSQHLWCCQLDAGSITPALPPASVVDLDSFSGLPACKGGSGDVTALGGHGECVAVARSDGQLLRLKLSPAEPQLQLEAAALAPRGMKSLRLSAKTTALAGRDLRGRLHILRATAPSGQRGE